MLRKKATKFLSTLLLGGIIFTGLSHVHAIRESQASTIIHFVSPYAPTRAVDYYLTDNGLVLKAVVHDNGNFTGEINFEPPVRTEQAVSRVRYDFPMRPVTPPQTEMPENNLGMQINL